MTFLVVGDGVFGKSPARFSDLPQALEYARGLARAGLGQGVYYEIAWITPEQDGSEDDTKALASGRSRS